MKTTEHYCIACGKKFRCKEDETPECIVCPEHVCMYCIQEHLISKHRIDVKMAPGDEIKLIYLN